MKVKPINKTIILKLTRDASTSSGLVYNTGRPEVGIVYDIGDKVRGIKPGDKVIFRKFMVDAEPTSVEGEKLFFSDDYEKSIVAVIHSDQFPKFYSEDYSVNFWTVVDRSDNKKLRMKATSLKALESEVLRMLEAENLD